MSAREIIAAIRFKPITLNTFALGALADDILADITSSGYRILAPGEMDRETLEAAAKVVDKRQKKWTTCVASEEFADDLTYMKYRREARTIAAAIRALGGGEG